MQRDVYSVVLGPAVPCSLAFGRCLFYNEELFDLTNS